VLLAKISGVTVFGIARSAQGIQVNDFDQVVRPDRLADADTWDASGHDEDDSPWEARLYVWPGQPNPPGWLAFLRDGFGDAVSLPDTTRSRAVVVMKVRWHGADRYYAVPFGDGRHQLQRELLDPSATRKVLLNAIYEGDGAADAIAVAERIRQVEFLDRGGTTMRTVRQASRTSDFDSFEFDPDVEQLLGVAGTPVNDQEFGRRVSGKNSVRLARLLEFDELAGICRNIARYAAKKDYQRRFEFVDRVAEIADASEIAELNEVLSAAVVEQPNSWEFAPPDVVDFDHLSTYRIELPGVDDVVESNDVAVPAIIDVLTQHEIAVSASTLQEIRLEGLDPDDAPVGSWSLYECLDGQLAVDESTYLLNSGRYSRVATDYLAHVDEQLQAIPLSAIVLPSSKIIDGTEISEGEYNVLAAESSDRYLLMDKRNVTIASRTSPVEVCDVLTLDGQLVHVKRSFSSATLSHLFSQGEISGVLLDQSPEFRGALRNKIAGDPPEYGALFADAAFRAGDFEIVYAIVGQWNDGAALSERLPFFSKVNLLKRASNLRRSGYKISFSRIQPMLD
jgi:uncharacterized protein (TIGR04141 family)